MRRVKAWLNDLQLRLFDEGNLPSTPSVPSAPSAPVESADSAIVPASELVHSSNFPQTSVLGMCTIILQQQVIPYRLERAKRRTVGMMIDGQGLRVRASTRVPMGEIERILRSKSNWIIKNLHQAALKKTLQPKESFVPNLDLADGDMLNLLGKPVQIRWGSASKNTPFHCDTDVVQELWVKTPRIRLDDDAQTASLKRENAVAAVLGVYLLSYLNRRAQIYALEFGLRYCDIALSNAKTLWGTCRQDRQIRMNWRLVFLDVALVDYVLAHELAHTIHMNHSPAFWQVVAQLCPDYRNLRRQLKSIDLRAA